MIVGSDNGCWCCSGDFLLFSQGEVCWYFGYNKSKEFFEKCHVIEKDALKMFLCECKKQEAAMTFVYSM